MTEYTECKLFQEDGKCKCADPWWLFYSVTITSWETLPTKQVFFQRVYRGGGVCMWLAAHQQLHEWLDCHSKEHSPSNVSPFSVWRTWRVKIFEWLTFQCLFFQVYCRGHHFGHKIHYFFFSSDFQMAKPKTIGARNVFNLHGFTLKCLYSSAGRKIDASSVATRLQWFISHFRGMGFC